MKTTRNSHGTLLACFLSLTGAATAATAQQQPMEDPSMTTKKTMSQGITKAGKVFLQKLMETSTTQRQATAAFMGMVLAQEPALLKKIVGGLSLISILEKDIQTKTDPSNQTALTHQKESVLKLLFQTHELKRTLMSSKKIADICKTRTGLIQEIDDLDDVQTFIQNSLKNPQVAALFYGELDAYACLATHEVHKTSARINHHDNPASRTDQEKLDSKHPTDLAVTEHSKINLRTLPAQ